MKTRLLFFGAIILCFATNGSTLFAATRNSTNFSLESESFTAGGQLPARLARRQVAGGENISPELHWQNPPAGTRGYALLCIDLHPVARRWIHWLVVNIPTDCESLPEGASGKLMPAGCHELGNSFGDAGWGGPQPPPGSGRHRYRFTLFALKCARLPAGIDSEQELRQAIQGKIAGQADLSGWFDR